MSLLNFSTLKQFDLCLITSSKERIQSEAIIALLYMKGVNFYHLEVTSHESAKKLSDELKSKCGIYADDRDGNLAFPVTFESKADQGSWSNSAIFGSKQIIFQFIDERWIANSIFPQKLSIWTTDNETHEVGSKHAIIMHTKILDELFDEKFEKYSRDLLPAEIRKEYEEVMIQSLTKRAPAHIGDSTFSLSESLNVLDLHYVIILRTLIEIENSFIHRKEFSQWIDYYNHASESTNIFKLLIAHKPNKSV